MYHLNPTLTLTDTANKKEAWGGEKGIKVVGILLPLMLITARICSELVFL